MGDEAERSGNGVTVARARVGRPRVITLELAERFAEELTADITHSVESASHEVGLNPRSVRDCLNRYERGTCATEEDELIGGILAAAKAKHVRELRSRGELAGGDKNGPGVAWYKWRCETQAPKEHPRQTSVEMSGPDGGPIQTQDVGKMSDAELDAKLAAAAKAVGGAE